MSSYKKQFILKGALMLRAWKSPETRPTMDIDMLGITENNILKIKNQILEIIHTEVGSDGIIFDSESLQTETITEDADYTGIRVSFLGHLENARVRMQIDIGFGDKVYPAPELTELPTILNNPAPSLLCYSKESAIAEKFEAMIKLGYLNSRMKDFYDIWLLSRQFHFECQKLCKAVYMTLEQRGTKISHPIAAFSLDYTTTHQTMWKAFLKRLKIDHAPESFQDIVKEVEIFLKPVIDGVTEDPIWSPAESWS
ncbi:MAG: nucleotidyl transferase AbiEii/AbiGii toxin family protein [Spirochaetales bacterium]|nr:nucleotidyl transferase AbiEii/AbiGii toxin family protein [Spirochaetales bacterium]